MFPVIDIGPVAIQAAGLALLLSLWVGIWLTSKFGKNLGTNADTLENAILIGLIAGILGARIGFVMQSPNIFSSNPLSIFSLSPTMLDASFGVLVGGITAFIFAQKHFLPLWPTLDSLSLLAVLIFAGLHLANFANGNAYGLPADIPWGIRLWNAVRHPVQIYALILAAGLFFCLIFQTKRLRTTGFMRSGTLFLSTAAGIGLITLITRAFVAEKTRFAGIDLLQLLGFFVLISSLALIYNRAIKPQKHIGVLISAGSNTAPERSLPQALETIQSKFKTRRVSSVYKTEAVERMGETPDFLNQVLEIETNLPYPDLISQLKAIEQTFGRQPGNKQVVPLDLDVLTYNNDVFTWGNHQVPDPDLVKYRYIALPLAEIAPDFRHPASGKSIQSILDRLMDDSQVNLVQEVENGLKG